MSKIGAAVLEQQENGTACEVCNATIEVGDRYCDKCQPRKGRGANILPVYKGYTVDIRLKQFRKCPIDAMMEFIDFDSEKGSGLLEEMRALDLNLESVAIESELGQRYLKQLNKATFGTEEAA
jgi:hypothetical protein